MKKIVSVFTVLTSILTATAIMAHNQVVIVPLGGNKTTGGITVGSDSSLCDISKAGTIRWTGSDFEGCNGTEWIIFAMEKIETVTSAGQIWMDRNLGASRVAKSSTDSAAYGDLYQWGRLADGHEKENSPTTTTLSTTDEPGHGSFIFAASYPYDWRTPQNNSLWQGVSGVNNPCPDGFRLQTEAEWEIERLSWSSNDAAGAFASPLKLVLAGYRASDGRFNAGSVAFYMSSTPTASSSYSTSLYFHSADASIVTVLVRGQANSVRCIKD